MSRRRPNIECAGACRLVCILIVISGIVIVPLSLFANPNYPTFWIEEFYVSALNKTVTNSTQNATLIYFGLKVHNENVAVGLHYNDFNLAFSYLPNATTSVFIGSYGVPQFYQGSAKTKNVKDVVETHGYSTFIMLNETMIMMMGSQGARKLKEEHGVPLVLNKPTTMVFRVDLVAQLRFEDILSPAKHRVFVGANVEVNDQTGEKVNKKGIQLA